MHMRTQIRNAVMNALEGLAANHQSAFAGRTNFVRTYRPGELDQREDCPKIQVKQTSEKSEINSILGTARLQRRIMEIVVIGTVIGTRNSDIQAELDAMAVEFESVVFQDLTLGGLSNNMVLMETEQADGQVETDPSGFINLRIAIEYYTLEGKPGAIPA